MKINIYDILQRQGLRLSLCAFAISFCTMSFAQDETEDFEEETETIAQPKRKTVVDDNVTYTIHGVVKDNATKQPVAGVRLQVLTDNRYAAMTDAEGKFTMKVPFFATSLFVQAPRYLSQQVSIRAKDEQSEVKISLLKDVYAPMYENGTDYTARNSFTSHGGGVTVDAEIQERLGADVRSIMHSGDMDGGASMFIRGINSLNSNSQPLVILDGVELDMQRNSTQLHQGNIFNMLSTISPEDIDKVTVLKNATALYGARGGNGVIIITTKRGRSMATRIDAKVSLGVEFEPRALTMMNAAQYRNYATSLLGTVPAVIENPVIMQKLNFLNDNPNGYYYHTYHNDTNWRDYVYRSALTQNYSINVQGGDDVGMYNLSVGYVESQGTVKETDFNRVNVRFNTDINILENFYTKFDMSFSRTNKQRFDDGFAADLSQGTITSPAALALIKSPLLNPYQYSKYTGGFTSLISEEDKLLAQVGSEFSLANPVTFFDNATGDNKNKLENTSFNIKLEPTFEFNRNLKLTTAFSYTLNRYSQKYSRPYNAVPAFIIDGLGTVTANFSSLFSKSTNVLSNTHLDWTQKYGGNSIALTGGFRYNYFSYDSDNLSSTKDNESTNDRNPNLGDGKYRNIDGVNDVWKNMQWYVNADYDYASKYFVTLSLLGEANSRFGQNISSSTGIKVAGVRWVMYPSIQLGWVMSNEDWFSKESFVNYLKVYAGFDVSGNDDISNYAARSSFMSVRYNANAPGLQFVNIGNDKIKAETTLKYNFGFKANMFDNRLSVGFDAYYHKTKDLLALKKFDNPIGGITNYWTNDGVLDNHGLELAISGKPIETKNLHVELGATMGTYRNRICHLTDGDYTASVYGDNNILIKSGASIGTFYGYQTTDHVFSTEAEAATAYNGTDYLKYIDDTGAEQKFNAGDVHFIDQNGDGFIDEKDKVVIGNSNPDIYGNIFATLTWKRFTVNMAFNYSVGNDVYNYQRSILNSGSTFYNQQVHGTGYWRYENQITDMPKLAYGDPKGNNRFSDRWIEDGSYLRMKTLSVAYQIPIPESWQSWLQGVSVWGEARNLFTITKYTGNDPEFFISNNQLFQGIDCGNVSMGRSLVFGVKINL